MKEKIREILWNFVAGEVTDSEAVQQVLDLFAVSGSVLEQIRQAFADYRRSEGCSCCRDMDAHEEAEKRLAELLKPEPYEDGSGWDWSKYCTECGIYECFKTAKF